MKTDPSPLPETDSRQPIALNSTLPPYPKGTIREREGSWWYCLEGAEGMEPFLMTQASDSDHWMFILSNGGLTAGRRNPDQALFPYYTQDKMLDLSGRSGSRTLIRRVADRRLWQPFSESSILEPGIRRNVSKNELGNQIELEEIHPGLQLALRVRWRPSGRFGFVRRVEGVNLSGEACRIELVDGLQNILPPGIGQRFQNEFSILGDAYKQAELAGSGQLGIYHLSSVPTDLSDPMEALQASVAWQTGMGDGVTVLTDRQLDRFRKGESLREESVSRGLRTSFLRQFSLELEAGESRHWYICADTALDRRAVEELEALLTGGIDLAGVIEEDCGRTEENLRRMLAGADGFQCTAHLSRALRHTSNTLFNLMRGGAFPTGYELPVGDVLATVGHFNREAARELSSVLAGGSGLHCSEPWQKEAPGRFGPDALRLLREYLPLSFSRRHGDPSRPWNRFSIDIREEDGSPKFSYQGNWRDIFQNWEALLHSWPEYSEAAICRFLNASTADGYNPYRVTKDGFEWEVLEPSDPWANIGYWGDHQVIYLLRLLETSVKFHPGRLESLLTEEAFVYAEVPYRIRNYTEILKNPRQTVDYDHRWAESILDRVSAIGADGKLRHDAEQQLVRVNLMEKLLVPLLAKLSNFVPQGGIWMNTQRPEWNDANNALVGYGVSVVTLGYVVRYLRFLKDHFGDVLQKGSFPLSRELARLLGEQLEVFSGDAAGEDEASRQRMMDLLGKSASTYREAVYTRGGLAEKESLPGSTILEFIDRALAHAESSLRANRREDGLWHSYNLLLPSEAGFGIQHLVVMLEGQVSVLSSGILDLDQTLELLSSLRQSKLYREDRDSYLLYPDKEMPAFLAKNRVPEEAVASCSLLSEMVAAGDSRILSSLPGGGYAFNGGFHNSKDLAAALRESIGKQASEASVREVLNLFERTFNHHAFTGRSGTFFAYEGLGSIYWHMVSKLVLAVQESCFRFLDCGRPGKLRQLADWYRTLRDGLGVDKNPGLYGAFPTDAYSHTPAHAGAQQPGMTGQVKEDILIRLAELGIEVAAGCIRLRPELLEADEFLTAGRTCHLLSHGGERLEIRLEEGSMAFTFCGVPFVYRSGQGRKRIRVLDASGTVETTDGLELPAETSREIFRRSGKVRMVEVDLE